MVSLPAGRWAFRAIHPDVLSAQRIGVPRFLVAIQALKGRRAGSKLMGNCCIALFPSVTDRPWRADRARFVPEQNKMERAEEGKEEKATAASLLDGISQCRS